MNQPVYLDNAASTPVRPDVLERMLPFLSPAAVGNPSSAHRFGRAARDALASARQEIASSLGAEPNHVIFTAGGTEADNLAILGAVLAVRERGGPFRIAASALEHPAVLEAGKAIQMMGGEFVQLSVDEQGRVDREQLQKELDAGLALVSVMWVNNEIGTVEDIPQLATICGDRGTLFHTDAVQAVGKVPCSMGDLPIDFLSLSGHKIGAPQGVGALVVRERRSLKCTTHGGGQQFGLRSGTENVPGIVGLGHAVATSVRSRQDDYRHFTGLRDRLEQGIREVVPTAVVVAEHAERAPHITNIIFPGIDSEAMVMHLDLAGIACSAGSACHTGTVEPSRVLTAIGVPPDLATRSIRFSFYKQNANGDVDRLLTVLPEITEKLRGLTAALGR
jgi:cysteine desulfurase